MMWVVFNTDTGWTDESMRFADPAEAAKFIIDNADPDYGTMVHDVRYESDSEHPNNHVALGQILNDGKWLDFARDTPLIAIEWARREPSGHARVVDWISRKVIWPRPEFGEGWS